MKKIMPYIAALVIFMPAHATAAQRIEINIPQYKMSFYDDGKLVKKYEVRVGKPTTPSPQGKGKIYEKRKNISFTKKGRLMKYCSTENDETIRVPYEDLRGLGMEIYTKRWGNTRKFVIHSTTEHWTIGTPASMGCVGLEINDMLDLYSRVNVPAEVYFHYDTIDVNPKERTVTIYADIYGKSTNNADALKKKLNANGISGLDEEKINRKIEEISLYLYSVVRDVKKKNVPKRFSHLLKRTIKIDDLTEYNSIP
jgi:hypothetical protein